MTTLAPNRLSNAQAMLLNLFQKDLPEDDLLEIKNLLTRHLFMKAQQAAQKAMSEKGISLADIEQTSKEISNGSRTEFLKKIRKQKHEGSN